MVTAFVNNILAYTTGLGYRPTCDIIGKEKKTVTDLDFVDEVTLFAEMLSVLDLGRLLALELMDMEALRLGLIISWEETKIRCLGRF